VTAATAVPGTGLISVVNAFVLSDPFNTPVESYGVSAALAPEAKAFLVRFYVDYLSPLPGGGYKSKRFEVPVAIFKVPVRISYLRERTTEFYPQPVRRSTPANPPGGTNFWGGYIRSEEQYVYTTEAYVKKLRSLYESEGYDVTFSRAVFYLMQFDGPLWNYWNVSNGFHDRYSIRIDDPEYTNITGGAGVFGSVVVDSTVLPLPEKMPVPHSH
jgi:hypothetical protein